MKYAGRWRDCCYSGEYEPHEVDCYWPPPRQAPSSWLRARAYWLALALLRYAEGGSDHRYETKAWHR